MSGASGRETAGPLPRKTLSVAAECARESSLPVPSLWRPACRAGRVSSVELPQVFQPDLGVSELSPLPGEQRQPKAPRRSRLQRPRMVALLVSWLPASPAKLRWPSTLLPAAVRLDWDLRRRTLAVFRRVRPQGAPVRLFSRRASPAVLPPRKTTWANQIQQERRSARLALAQRARLRSEAGRLPAPADLQTPAAQVALLQAVPDRLSLPPAWLAVLLRRKRVLAPLAHSGRRVAW